MNILDAKKYELSDSDWNLENVNAKVKELENDAREAEKMLATDGRLIGLARYNNFLMEIYHTLQSLWLNRNSDSRFPEWFEDLYIPEEFKEMFDDIFGDLDVGRE